MARQAPKGLPLAHAFRDGCGAGLIVNLHCGASHQVIRDGIAILEHLADPYCRLVHNGERNTVRGNENWMRAWEAGLESPLLGADRALIKPVIESDGSATAKLDNVLDLLLAAGRTLPWALRTIVPEAWENDPLMAPERRTFYDFHSTLMEPWDGPALVVAADGRYLAPHPPGATKEHTPAWTRALPPGAAGLSVPDRMAAGLDEEHGRKGHWRTGD